MFSLIYIGLIVVIIKVIYKIILVKNMSSLLIISAVFPPEPVVSSLLSGDIAEAMANSNDVVVLCPTPTRPDGFVFDYSISIKEYEVVRLNSYTSPKSTIYGRFYESFSFGRSCVHYLRKNKGKFKCIYINSWPLLSQYMIIKEAKRQSIPSVLHVQDIYPESLINKISYGKVILKNILLPIDQYTLSNSKYIIAISEKMKHWLVKTRNLSPEKIHVIANWQDETSFISYQSLYQKKDASEKPLIFMYLGNIGPVAGVEYVIRAYNKANLKHSNLIIAGEGSCKKACMDLVTELKSNSISFLNVPNGMVPEVQHQADILLLPVKKNAAMSSIPSKLPAYMFSSKPIIGSLDLDSDTAEAIRNAGCGLVVLPEDEVELISALKIAAGWSKSERESKGLAGFEYAIKHFSKKNNLSEVLSLINRLL
jgi:glycosyltransferase involved in cell wall biosynthesis